MMKLERVFAWGFIGALLGVAGLYYALHERRAHVVFSITGQSDILDVRQPLADLAITYQGADVQANNLNLRSIRLRVGNDGEADLLQAQYDQSLPWGLVLQGGRILKVQLAEASSQYLRSNVNPTILTDTSITMSKVILERGRSFTLEFLVLHSKPTAPSLRVLGKIAGADSLPVGALPEAPTSPGVWRQSTEGPFGVQLMRAVVYTLGSLLLIIALSLASAGIGTYFSNRAHERRAQDMRLALPTESPEDVVARDILVDLYATYKVNGLRAAKRIIRDPEFAETATSRAELLLADDESIGDLGTAELVHRIPVEASGKSQVARYYLETATPESPRFAVLLGRKLRKSRLIVSKGGAKAVHPAFAKLLDTALQAFDTDVIVSTSLDNDAA